MIDGCESSTTCAERAWVSTIDVNIAVTVVKFQVLITLKKWIDKRWRNSGKMLEQPVLSLATDGWEKEGKVNLTWTWEGSQTEILEAAASFFQFGKHASELIWCI